MTIQTYYYELPLGSEHAQTDTEALEVADAVAVALAEHNNIFNKPKDIEEKVISTNLYLDIDLTIKVGKITIKYSKIYYQNKIIYQITSTLNTNQGNIIYSYLRDGFGPIETRVIFGDGLFNLNSIVSRSIILNNISKCDYNKNYTRILNIITN